MYWFSFPAIMKGWIDRVLTKGYAYSMTKRYSQGLFKVPLTSSVTLVLVRKFKLPFTHRARKQFCPSPLGLKSWCSVQMALMGTWMSPCGQCRYCIMKHQQGELEQSTDWLSYFSEWHPELLWLPGSGPSDLLGTISCFSRGASQHAGELARALARNHEWKAPVLHSSWLLWRGEGLCVEAWGVRETSRC